MVLHTVHLASPRRACGDGHRIPHVRPCF
jgi:hypothetical protein